MGTHTIWDPDGAQDGTLVRMHREPLNHHTPSLGGGPSGRRGDLGSHQWVKWRWQPGWRASLQGGGSSLPWAPLRPTQHLCEPRRQEGPPTRPATALQPHPRRQGGEGPLTASGGATESPCKRHCPGPGCQSPLLSQVPRSMGARLPGSNAQYLREPVLLRRSTA